MPRLHGNLPAIPCGLSTLAAALSVAAPGEWSYVAVIFSTGGRPANPDWSLDGVLNVFFDQNLQSGGEWYYVAVVLNTNGSLANPDGTVTGSVTVCFDGRTAVSVTDDVTKSNAGDSANLGIGIGQNPTGGSFLDGRVFEPRLVFGPLGPPIATTEGITKSPFGDSLDRGIGVGMHPMGAQFPSDFFDGMVFEPRVTLGALAPEELLYGGEVIEGPMFHRGDANADGGLNITDGIFVLNFLFLGGDTPPCMEAANANDDGDINITDGIYILNFLFLGGPEPLPPGPPSEPCGMDPADSPSDLGCDTYDEC